MFTLNPIKGVDNRDFIFRFVPTSGLVSDVYDTVQLIVKGKKFYQWLFFHHGGWYEVSEWASNAIEFQQFWLEITSLQTKEVLSWKVVALPLRELLQ